MKSPVARAITLLTYPKKALDFAPDKLLFFALKYLISEIFIWRVCQTPTLADLLSTYIDYVTLDWSLDRPPPHIDDRLLMILFPS